MKLNFSLISLLILTSCVAGTNSEIHAIKKLKQPLSKLDRIGVQIPKDGRYEHTIYEGSGIKTATAFEHEFRKHNVEVELLNCLTNHCAQIASDKGLSYILILEILHWEERQTTWSGRTDRLTIQATVINVPMKDRLTSSYLQGVGTRNTLGGEHVQDLLLRLASEYISSLY